MGAKVTLILGESGSGKSRSIKNLPPKNTFIINIVGKDLPFKGSSSSYPLFNKETGEGNMLISKDWGEIAKVLKYVNTNRPEIKAIVIDDNQYLSLFTYTSRINETSWNKFNTITVNTVDLVDLLKSLRDNLLIFIMQHIENGSDVEGNEQIQAKTLGKFVKEKLVYEGLFTIVLLCDKKQKDDGTIEYFIWTSRANSTVKCPEDLFDSQKIPNDLLVICKAISNYYK